MADQSLGIHYPLDYNIQDLNIISSNGNTMNFKRLMLAFSYFEDLYSFCTSGSLSVIDAQGFIENLQLTGNEYLKIEIGKMKDAPDNINLIFRIYKVDKRKSGGSMNSESYDILFCSEEMFLSEQTKVSKSYRSVKVTDIINDIMTNYLKVDTNKTGTVETTTGVYNFVVPNMKPFEAISWLSTYAMSSKYPGADMLFYQTKEGFNFRSLQSIYSDNVYATYKYQQKNVDYDVQQNEDKQLTVKKFEFIKTYDSLNEVSSGTFANRLVSIDPLIRSYYVTDFDYTKYQGSSKMLNNNPPSNFYTNRLGDTQTSEYNGVLKLAMSNQNETQVSYIQSKPDAVGKNVFVETTVPLRTAQLSLANYTRIKLTIPGDPAITVGKTIGFDLNSLSPNIKSKELDKYYSGKYIVTAVHHVYLKEEYQTLIEIAKESSPTQYQSVANSSDWQQAIIS